jgi:F0F1-type ATP synthase membrane subunit b/b'
LFPAEGAEQRLLQNLRGLCIPDAARGIADCGKKKDRLQARNETLKYFSRVPANVSPTLTTFLFEAANFLLLAAALGWFFFRPVRQALADRRGKFEAEAQQAAAKLAEAESMQRTIAAAHEHLQQELNELRAREQQAARAQADRLLADARLAADRERELVRRQTAQLSDLQREALAQVAAAAAAAAVGELLERISGPDLEAALIRSACDQLRNLPGDALAPVKVESARPLDAAQRAELEAILGPAAVGAEFRTAEGLGAGLRISTAKGLIDASVGGLARFARQALAQEMNHRAGNHQFLQNTRDV